MNLTEFLEYLKETGRISNYEVINKNEYLIQPVKAIDKITLDIKIKGD